MKQAQENLRRKKTLQFLLFISFIFIFALKPTSAAGNETGFRGLPSAVMVAEKFFGDDADELLKAVVELFKQKKYDEALAGCVKAAELNPKDFRPHYLSGVIYSAQEKHKNASDAFAKASELKPDDKLLYIFKATADQKRGAKDEAVAACRKALALDPNYIEAYYIIGDTLRDDEKRRAESEEAFRMAVKIDPNFPIAMEQIGERRLYVGKDAKGAEDAFKRAMQLDPNQMAGRFALGRLLVEQGRLAEARAVWEGRKSDTDNTYPNFITLLERAENRQKASAALALKPNDPETLLQMGNAVMDGDSWVVDGRQEKAIVYFRKALTIKPDFAAAQFAICKAYVQIADTYKPENKTLDKELVKLRQMDAKLAKDLEDYRKTYSGGLRAAPLSSP
jgi:tetratricopeptide (TPR) repeat protein